MSVLDRCPYREVRLYLTVHVLKKSFSETEFFFFNFCPSLNAFVVLCNYCQFINLEYLSFRCHGSYAFHSVG